MRNLDQKQDYWYWEVIAKTHNEAIDLVLDWMEAYQKEYPRLSTDPEFLKLKDHIRGTRAIYSD